MPQVSLQRSPAEPPRLERAGISTHRTRAGCGLSCAFLAAPVMPMLMVQGPH